MFQRASAAEQALDPRWLAMPNLPARTFDDEFEAFWVAECQEEDGISLVGMIGIQSLQVGEAITASHPLVREWLERGPVAELRRLRIAEEMRGQGLATRLCQMVIAWAREHSYRTLVVNTTTPQVPALQLYKKLGFREAGISFLDRYELVWLGLEL